MCIRDSNETASFARFAFYPDCAVMKFHNTFCQCQSDACTGSGIQRVEMFGLIETVEYLINFGSGDTCPGIFYFNDEDVYKRQFQEWCMSGLFPRNRRKSG